MGGKVNKELMLREQGALVARVEKEDINCAKQNYLEGKQSEVHVSFEDVCSIAVPH